MQTDNVEPHDDNDLPSDRVGRFEGWLDVSNAYNIRTQLYLFRTTILCSWNIFLERSSE
jgi:hypothetical protein